MPKACLRTARLRANPAYELVLLDRLSAPEQQALESLSRDPECYGVLRPRHDARLTLKSVSRDTALLWLTLQQPGPLPKYALHGMGDSCDQTIGQMVLDGVLEIETDAGMISGSAARPLISGDEGEVDAHGTLPALSRRALEYAAVLPTTDVMGLSLRLYGYNGVPATPQWRHRWPDLAAVERDLEIEHGAWSKLLPGWTRVEWGDAWIAWSSPHAKPSHNEATCKLYISPACQAVRTAFHEAAAIAASHAVALKIGASVFGLVRPDKMVAYFEDIADLHQAALRIEESLAGCPAQGVPFTAEIGGDGLLSWGADPAPDKYAVPWLQRESWRRRICNLLAAALNQAWATADHDSQSLCRFALERLALEGIDTKSWAPTPEIHRS